MSESRRPPARRPRGQRTTQRPPNAPPARRREAARTLPRVPYSMDYDDPLLAEIYDQVEDHDGDIRLLRRLIAETWAEAGSLQVLEPFCGTGRILLALAQDGHRVTGIELARAMCDRAARKAEALGPEVASRVALRLGDALDGDWGEGYDLVVIGANALYELPSPGQQERCIALAAEALAPGGYLYLDNDDYKGTWGQGLSARPHTVFSGTGADGSYGRLSMTPLSFDPQREVLVIRRLWYTRSRDGQERRSSYEGRKHPVRMAEERVWLGKHALQVERLMGDRQGNAYGSESECAIFWATKRAG